ncbi:hypothetical protein Tco_1276644, partial [Tanacetum coccineum]
MLHRWSSSGRSSNYVVRLLMNTGKESLLSVDPLKRGSAGSALESKFFSTCPDDATLRRFQNFKQGDTNGAKKL